MMIRDDASEKKQSEGKRLHGEEMFRRLSIFPALACKAFKIDR
jgi:hypothetical protein